MRRRLNDMPMLFVEDPEELAGAVATGRRKEGMAVDVALDRTADTGYDVVLDRDVSQVRDDAACRALVASRTRSRSLMLTASGMITDRVEGLGLGADDCPPKRCDFAELVARVRALARRSASSPPPTNEHADLTVDPARRVAVRGGCRVDLTAERFGVLEHLLAAGGRLVSTHELLDHIRDENADSFSNAVKLAVTRLRAKLGGPGLLRTDRQGRCGL